jgi:hypothetical protein
MPRRGWRVRGRSAWHATQQPTRALPRLRPRPLLRFPHRQSFDIVLPPRVCAPPPPQVSSGGGDAAVAGA